MKKLSLIITILIALACIFAKPAPVIVHRVVTDVDTLIPKILLYWNTDNSKYVAKWVAASRTNGGGDIQPPPTAVITEHDSTLAEGQDSILLHGDGSFSASSSITSYAWTQIAGGDEATIVSPSSANTLIKTFLGLGGDFTFRLTVTDDNGKTGHADIVITKPGLHPDQFFVNGVATFNFTPFAQDIDGYTDVVGDPSVSTVTATSPNGWTVSTISPDSTRWKASSRLGKGSGVLGLAYSTPADPYGFKFDSLATSTGFINANSQYVPGTYNLKLSGLNPNHLYQLHFIGSISVSDSTSGSVYSTRTNYTLSNGVSKSLNTQLRSSKDIVFDTVHPDGSGQIFAAINGQDSTYTSGSFGVLSVLQIYDISKDSSSGSQRTELYKHYYDTMYLYDGTVNRLCIIYKPYNYNPDRSYPVIYYLDGQEDAVKDNDWDPSLLTGDGIGIVAEHNKGSVYGIDKNGDTASAFIVFPQTRLTGDWSLTAAQSHTLLQNFKSRVAGTYHINDTLFVAGFSSGAAGAENYLYSYPSEVTAAFIQSPAPGGSNSIPSNTVIRDTSAKFTEYGVHVWTVKRGDAFADNIDTLNKYISLYNPANLYTRYWGRDHSGFAQEYTQLKNDPVYEQNIYDFFFNPTANARRVAFFSFKNTAGAIPDIYTNVIGSPTYNQPSQGVLTGTDSLTGWTVTTGATSKFSGNTYRNQGSIGVFNAFRLLPYYTNSYVLGNGGIMNAKSGGYATNGYNMTVSNLSPDSSYILWFSGSAALNGDYSTAITVNGNTVTQNNSQQQETIMPVKIEGTADGSGNLSIGFYPANSGDTAVLNYMIIKEKYPSSIPYVNAGTDQTIQLPTTSTTLSGIATSYTGTISSTTWSNISKPGNETISFGSASSLSTTVSGLIDEGDYSFKLSATDNNSVTVTDTVIVHVAAAPASFSIGDRMLIDLGGSGAGASDVANPDVNGRYWNTLDAPNSNTSGGAADYTSFKDTSGTSVTGFEITTEGAWWSGQLGVNTAGGNASGVGDYVANATIDSWIVNTSQSPQNLNIKLPAGTYTIKFWGARATSGTLTASVKLSTDESYTTYNASNNATFTNGATFTGVVSDGSTPVVFNVSGESSSNGFGYFGVIDIKRTE